MTHVSGTADVGNHTDSVYFADNPELHRIAGSTSGTRFSPSLRGSSTSRIRSDPAGFAAYSIGVRIILQVLLGVGFGLLCAYLSWGGPRDPDAADLVPAPEPAHSAVAAPQRVRHDTHFS